MASLQFKTKSKTWRGCKIKPLTEYSRKNQLYAVTELMLTYHTLLVVKTKRKMEKGRPVHQEKKQKYGWQSLTYFVQQARWLKSGCIYLQRLRKELVGDAVVWWDETLILLLKMAVCYFDIKRKWVKWEQQEIVTKWQKKFFTAKYFCCEYNTSASSRLPSDWSKDVPWKVVRRSNWFWDFLLDEKKNGNMSTKKSSSVVVNWSDSNAWIKKQ